MGDHCVQHHIDGVDGLFRVRYRVGADKGKTKGVTTLTASLGSDNGDTLKAHITARFSIEIENL